MSPIQESAITRIQPPRNEEIIDEVIKLMRKIRRHIQNDDCMCCRQAVSLDGFIKINSAGEPGDKLRWTRANNQSNQMV
ncbi:MAG TPA: hypothetical protein VH796_18775 [Nitrososphaeraceae archaeon]